MKIKYKQRLVKVKPLLDAFFSWLDAQNISGKGKLAKAVGYALNEKKYLYTFLEDGNVRLITIVLRMRFVRLQLVVRTGCSTIQSVGQNAVRFCIQSFPQLRLTDWMPRSI